MRVLAVVLVAACGSSSPLPPISATTPAPAPSSRAAPVIEWVDNHLVANALPAVARSGALVVLGVEASDGARGNPNFTIVTRDRRDREVMRSVVLTVTEADMMIDETGPMPELRDRMTAANATLATLHAEHDLVSLTHLALDTGVPPSQQAARGADVVVAWRRAPDRVTIILDGAAIYTHDAPAAWLAKPHKMCTTCPDTCENPAFLGDGWADVERRVAVIEIDYEGTDSCWEPDSQLHVLAW